MSAPTAAALAETLAPLTQDPGRAAVLCDIDGTLAPIVERADQARVDEEIAAHLRRLAGRYACVACISGRPAAAARELVGVDGIAYAGSHGAELLLPGSDRPRLVPEFKSWEDRVREFTRQRDSHELRSLGIRLEDKGPIAAFHWRGAPDEDAARAHLERVGGEAGSAGLSIHWARKVLEVRPPVPIDKGDAVRNLIGLARPRAALFGGDDATDLDAYDALDALVEDGRLDFAVRVGVRSDEGPASIVDRADLVVDGVDGFTPVLATLAAA